MNLEVLKNEEKQMNLIMFLVSVFLPTAAFSFVMLFLDGTAKDACVFLISALGILVRIFEKQLKRYAKYIYISLMPVIGAFVIVFANDGKFGAMTQAYFLYLIFSIAYYDVSVVIVNVISTIVTNFICAVFFTDSYLLMHSIIIWIFIMIVFLLAAFVAAIITSRTYKLFKQIEVKENQSTKIIQNVKHSFENLKSSSDSIYNTLDQFSNLSHKIADYSKEIADGSIIQTNEVSDSLNMYNELADRIIGSEEKVNKTVEYMGTLKENNEIGLVSIKKLSDTFGETLESTETASYEIKNLSEKSKSIADIIEVINGIAEQTNLLALNAAIEAARAGELGKGFAVVSDEIKKLAEQSKDSTQSVNQILTDVITIVEKTRKTMDRNKTIVKESNDKLEVTVNAFNNIVYSSEEVINITAVLDNELKNMKVLKDQLLDSMKKLASISESSVTSTTEVSASTEEQAGSIENIIKSMELVQNSISSLSSIIHNDTDKSI